MSNHSNLVKERYQYIDLLESIAMLMVIIYHSCLTKWYCLDGSLYGYFEYYFNSLLSMCVPLFFFANGFLLLNREFHLKKHIIKTAKLILLLLFWGAVKLLVLMPIKGEFLTLRGYLSDLYNMRYLWISNHWYIAVLISVYFFVPIIKATFDSNYKAFLFFAVICFILTIGNTAVNEFKTILSVIMHRPTVSEHYNFFKELNPLREIKGYAFVYFCLGGILGKHKERIIAVDRKKRVIIAAIGMTISTVCLTLIGMMYSNLKNAVWDNVFFGYDTIFTFVNVILLFSVLVDYRKNIKLIYLISSNSLGIYFIHDIFTNLFTLFTDKHEIFHNVIAGTAVSIVILLISLLLTLCINKIPILSNMVSLKTKSK